VQGGLSPHFRARRSGLSGPGAASIEGAVSPPEAPMPVTLSHDQADFEDRFADFLGARPKR
jgi:hypothetical protein